MREGGPGGLGTRGRARAGGGQSHRAGKHAKAVRWQMGQQQRDRRFVVILGVGTDDGRSDRAHPVDDAGAQFQHRQDFAGLIRQRCADVDDAQVAAGRVGGVARLFVDHLQRCFGALSPLRVNGVAMSESAGCRHEADPLRCAVRAGLDAGDGSLGVPALAAVFGVAALAAVPAFRVGPVDP